KTPVGLDTLSTELLAHRALLLFARGVVSAEPGVPHCRPVRPHVAGRARVPDLAHIKDLDLEPVAVFTDAGTVAVPALFVLVSGALQLSLVPVPGDFFRTLDGLAFPTYEGALVCELEESGVVALAGCP